MGHNQGRIIGIPLANCGKRGHLLGRFVKQPHKRAGRSCGAARPPHPAQERDPMRIASFIILPLALMASSSASGQVPALVEVHLSNFRFTPRTLVFDHGRPYTLRIVNRAGGGHDFTAPEFFARANVAGNSRAMVEGGEVEVPPGQAREIRLVAPPAGTYQLKCSHSFHKFFGMSGTIIVR
jgi:uncharacterized cupredoxin-like copper-binding protein